ncbi:MAG TPA: hypothetical protein ENK10_02045 [Acidobacteria bacterium]|nr:hypothetical protein [Acidobacteriota bacterium]
MEHLVATALGSLTVGLLVGLLIGRRARQQAAAPPVTVDDSAPLRESLAAAEAAYHSLAEQVDEARQLSRARLHLLETMAERGLPVLERLEEQARSLMDPESADSWFDRRAGLGPLANSLRDLTVEIRDLLVLGRVEGPERSPRSEIVEIHKLLAAVADEHSALSFEPDSSLPALIRSDRGLLHLVLDKLGALSAGAQGAVMLEAGVEPLRGDLVELSIAFRGLDTLPEGAAERLTGESLEELAAEGRQWLTLAVAHGAVERLGGSLAIVPGQRGEDLLLRLVVATASDRRTNGAGSRVRRNLPVGTRG